MSSRLRIVHLITSLDVGGAEMMLFRLLQQMGHSSLVDNTVIVMLRAGSIGEKITELGVPVLSLEMQPGKPSLRAFVRLIRELRRFQPDILQTWLYHADLMGLFVGYISGVPSVVWNVRASDADMSRYRPLSGWTQRACAWLSSCPLAILVNSTAGRIYHERIGYRPRRWVLIPNGVDTEYFKPDILARKTLRRELALTARKILIGYIARFDPMKDHSTFFRAAQELLKRYPDIHFILCGMNITWENHELVRMIDSAGLRNRVHLLGSRDDIAQITASLDVATSASISEGFSNVIVEAMACGVPCVVTDVGDSATIIGQTGVVVSPGNPQALCDGWAQLIEIGNLGRQELGAIARERVAQQYSLKQITHQYETFYRDIQRLHNKG